MNLFQATVGREVEVLMAARHAETGRQLWFEGVVVSRDFWRASVCIDLAVGTIARTIISCEDDFELPRVRPMMEDRNKDETRRLPTR
ncbi:MAG: hypothetical protein U9Q07_04070 [Planctomycetota bacterium]|nr:hypothetical protein [Planctomycetota bacterium]